MVYLRKVLEIFAGLLVCAGSIHLVQLSALETPLPVVAAEEPEGPLASSEVSSATSTQVGRVQDIQVPPPPFTEDIFPCMDCHSEIEPNSTPRKLEDYHDEIVLLHDEENRWCLDCHDEQDRDQLRLASGKRIPFEQSYLLCGQCHGPKLRDWKAGVHGKRSGHWDGTERRYLLCVHCHNPHQPQFPALAPMPKPHAPGQLRALLKEPIQAIVFDPITPIDLEWERQWKDGDSQLGDDHER